MAVTEPAADRRRVRHQAKKLAIVAAAWELARDLGVGGLSLRALADRVGLRQPSLYAYFDSKLDLYDAMFAESNQHLLERMAALTLPPDPQEAVKAMAREFAAFCTEDPTRYQLLFMRTIPGFEPSPASYALAIRFLDWFCQRLAMAGVRRQDHVDIFIAMLAGLIDAQLANEPEGSRWIRHVDWTIGMLLREVNTPGRPG